MDERYLRFPRWLEFSGLPTYLVSRHSVKTWLVFRRLVEEDLAVNLFPDWFDLRNEMADFCGISPSDLSHEVSLLVDEALIRLRGSGVGIQQVCIRVPLAVPESCDSIKQRLHRYGLPEEPEVWRYWEQSEGESKYQRVARLYEQTCGLKITPRIIEDLVELAESYPVSILEKGFKQAQKEGVTTLGWIRKHLRGIQKHERIQKNWGRPEGLSLPEGYEIPSRDGELGGG